jgi:hypothetical protein
MDDTDGVEREMNELRADLHPVPSAKRAPRRYPRIDGDAVPRPFDALPRPWMQALLDHTAAASTIRLLLVLLGHTDRKTRHTVTATDKVAAKARIHRRNIRKALEALEALGILAVDWSRRGHPVAVFGAQTGDFVIVPRTWRAALLSLTDGAALRLALLLLSLVRYRQREPGASYRVTHPLVERKAHIRHRSRVATVDTLQRLNLVEIVDPLAQRTEVRLLHLYDPQRAQNASAGTP